MVTFTTKSTAGLKGTEARKRQSPNIQYEGANLSVSAVESHIVIKIKTVKVAK